MTTIIEGLTGRSRVTVFVLFGTVFGYATHHLDQRKIGEVAIIGPLSPGADWLRLWQMAANMCKEGATRETMGQWILAQATRAFVVGSDRIAKLEDQDWKLEPGGRKVSFGTTYAHRDEVWTGNMTVEGLTPEQVAEQPSIYRA
ncbi:hypothetical protein [Streptomyces sp. NRRL F-2580]|uniref:hypothetical protein n=1 Tax=Streptomyces sp. NRRL F-2580 TaxID=1463841 RepID=UPI0004C82C5F|nr:hypothetical protein [Streptomyces sp. NRRL F-2580]